MQGFQPLTDAELDAHIRAASHEQEAMRAAHSTPLPNNTSADLVHPTTVSKEEVTSLGMPKASYDHHRAEHNRRVSQAVSDFVRFSARPTK